MTDQLWDDIADLLSGYRRQTALKIEAEYYDHKDYLDMALDAMIAAIVDAAAYACAIEDDEPLPSSKHEHFTPDGRRMIGNCDDPEWGMTVLE